MAQREGVSVTTVRQVFRGVKRACYAGLDATTLRTEVARRAAPVVPAEAFALSLVDPDTGLMTDVFGSGLPPKLVTTFIGHVYPWWEADLLLALARSEDPVATLVTRRARPAHPSPFHSSAYRQLLREHGVAGELRAALRADGEFWGCWCLLRDGSRARFTGREQRFVRRIAPHIARGLRNATLVELAREGAALERAGEETDLAGPGVVVLDPRGRVTLRNRAAAAQLADLGGLSPEEPGEEVPLVVLQLVATLRARLRDERPDRPDEATMRLRGRSGHWYALRACLAEPSGAGDPVSVVTIRMADRRQVAGLLARLYSLSSREREVLALAARGASTKQIAARLGISPYTVQDHLGHACAKVGVRGRRELLAKLFFDASAPRLDA